MMKRAFYLLALVLMLSSCSPNKEELVRDFVDHLNNERYDQAGTLISNDFSADDAINEATGKGEYISRRKLDEEMDRRIDVTVIREDDDRLYTKEKLSTILDSLLEIDVNVHHYKTYTIKDGQISGVKLDSTSGQDAYEEAFNKVLLYVATAAEDKHGSDYKSESNVKKDLVKLSKEYSALSAEEKREVKLRSNLKGTYVCEGCLYDRLEFKGKSTVVVYDGFFGFPFPSSYELDEEFIRIRTDKSDLLLEVIDEETLEGDGWARGTFKKVN